MPPDAEMKYDYALVLKQLQQELDGLDGRRQALLASIAAIRRLVADDHQQQLDLSISSNGRRNDQEFTVRMPAIPPEFFRGKSPTTAYRDLMERWPGYYKPPQIADLFMDGGMAVESRTALVQAIHSVIKREKQKNNRDR